MSSLPPAADRVHAPCKRCPAVSSHGGGSFMSIAASHLELEATGSHGVVRVRHAGLQKTRAGRL